MPDFKPETPRISEMYDLASHPTLAPLPDHIDTAFVYGRKSSHLEAAVREIAPRSVNVAGSGGVGKDSGDLPHQGITEIDYLFEGLDQPTYRDYTAWTGYDGARMGVDMIQRHNLPHDTVVTLQPPVQAVRLGGAFRQRAKVAGLVIGTLTHAGTSYPFKAGDIFDQYEVANEITLIDTFSQGRNPMLVRPEGLSEEMVEYATLVKRELRRQFREKGIRNPSTADDTNRAISPVRMMLLSPRSNLERVDPSTRGLAIAGRGLGLAVAFARQQRTRLPI